MLLLSRILRILLSYKYKVLVTGGEGQLANEFKKFSSMHDFLFPDKIDMDIRN